MDHRDHVALVRPGFDGVAAGETWLDAGAGRGAFTLAAADLLGPGATLIALDRDASALEANARSIAAAFPGTDHRVVVGDLRDRIEVPDGSLDGIVAANVLHFLEPDRRPPVVAALVRLLRAGGRFVLVEYETERPTPWLPYPLPLDDWEDDAPGAGLTRPRRIGTHRGASGGGMYAALAVRVGPSGADPGAA